MLSKKVVIVSAVRTPIGGFLGSLKSISQIDLAGLVIQEAVNRANVEKSLVDEVIVGNVGQIAESGFIARAASIKAGLPLSTTSYSVNRQCGSGLQSIVDAALLIATDNAEICVACGTENMSQLPFYLKGARTGMKMGHSVLEDGLLDILTWPLGPFHNGLTAENVAEKYHITRDMQDNFAVLSQTRAIEAIDQGRFEDQILPVEIINKKETILFSTDEYPRRGLTLENLSRLRPAFVESGSVTAGNSSGINDGAAAVVMMSEDKARELGYKEWMTFVDYAVAGNEPEYMGFAPTLSTTKLLERHSMKVADLDLVELNEAFASQSVAVIQALGLDEEKTNVNGGAIALGHPVGATGCVLPVKVYYELKRRKKQLGLVTMCIGGGQGISALFRYEGI